MSEYELMEWIRREQSYVFPDGIDSEACTLGNALQIIKWLLKHDEDVKGKYKLKKT